MDAVEPTLTPSDPLAETIRYYRNHWEALFLFVDYPEIPTDNSASEREYQHVAKVRLNCLFAGRPRCSGSSRRAGRSASIPWRISAGPSLGSGPTRTSTG